MSDLFLLEEFIKEALLDEVKPKSEKAKHHPDYNAPEGSKRAKQLDATKADLASGDPERIERGRRRRERMEKDARDKKKKK